MIKNADLIFGIARFVEERAKKAVTQPQRGGGYGHASNVLEKLEIYEAVTTRLRSAYQRLSEEEKEILRNLGTRQSFEQQFFERFKDDYSEKSFDLENVREQISGAITLCAGNCVGVSKREITRADGCTGEIKPGLK